MPIYLPPVSRRQFLRRAFVSAAFLCSGGSVFAALARRDRNSWALLADTHIPADRAQKARGINMADHLAIVCNHLAVLPKQPAGVLIAGDCAYNTGESGDYRLMGELLEPLRKRRLPLHLILGNHDNRERFRQAMSYLSDFPSPVVDKQVAILRSARVNWFLLDSLESTNSTPGHLGEGQLDWLAGALDSNQSKPAIIMVHHHPSLQVSTGGLKDTQALLDLIRPRKQVKAYVFGHTHLWKVQTDPSGIHFINLPPVGYVFREGMPAGWVHATVERDGMTLQLRCIDSANPAHGEVAALKWRT